jgi:hypothetical protein
MDQVRYSNWDDAKKSILQDWDLQQDNKMFGRKKPQVENVTILYKYLILNWILTYSGVEDGSCQETNSKLC